MRITNGMYYKNIDVNSSRINQNLFDVNKQIASGRKIQYAHDDVEVFAKTLHLDDEVTTLDQVKKSSVNGLKFSTQTDTVINEFTSTLDSINVKLITAANEIHSPDSMEALAKELRALEKHLISLANTSINGQYLFSGSKTSTEPIDADGIYHGNDGELKSFLGSGLEQKYNISGADLFLGEESTAKRKITLNVQQLNQTKLHPNDMTNATTATSLEEFITKDNSIRDLMGDDDDTASSDLKHHFYIRGTNHDGVAFKDTVSMQDSEKVDELLVRIGEAFGNTASAQLVDVNLTPKGQIEITDRRPGSSKLDFHMVANTDSTGAATDLDSLNSNGTYVKSFMKSDFTQFVSTVGQIQNPFSADNFSIAGDFLAVDGAQAQSYTLLSDVLRSDVSSIVFGGVDSNGIGVASSFDVLATSTMQDLVNAIDGAYDANVSGVGGGDLDFSIQDGNIVFDRQNGFAAAIDIQLQANDAAGGAGNVVNGLAGNASVAYDESALTKDGNTISGNVSQIVKVTNEYATSSTKLIDVATTDTLDNKHLSLSGININGTAFNATVDLDSAGSTFSLDGGVTNYSIFNMSTPRSEVAADEMTYQQLNDVINMIVTNNLPATNDTTGYDNAIVASDVLGNTSLDFKGRISFKELNETDTLARLSVSDVDASNMSAALVQQVENTVLSANLVAGDTISVTINGNSYSRVFGVDHDTTMTNFANDISAEAGVTAAYDALTNSISAVADVAGTGFTLSSDYAVTSTLAGTAVAGPGVDVSNGTGTNPSVLSLQSNNALVIVDAKTDFFERIDEIISSVEEGNSYSDSRATDPRNGGIQNSIEMIEDIKNHITKQHTVSGVQSQVLEHSINRSEILKINTETLRSEILDTDIAEAYMRLEQLKLNQQAIYSTVSKISQLSLVNYL
ncbi:MAG: flagellar hook-associated protein FlgL [Campylobacterota bacterium]|nr:flagellar hook-associated protein FlgL [Campylobacterota bacterium]